MKDNHRMPRQKSRRYSIIFSFIVIITIVMLSPAIGYVHHGWAEFDQTEEITVAGTVENPVFEYPHSTMRLISEDGTIWEIQMAPPRRITRMGVTEDNLTEGITVTVTGHPHREEERLMRIFEITIDDERLNIR